MNYLIHQIRFPLSTLEKKFLNGLSVNMTMSCQPYDPLTYLPLLFWIPEDKPFQFFDLPLLVQEKILRQYVPVFPKIHTLSLIPHFSDLLHCRSSWLNVSDEFAQLIPILRLIQEGMYVLEVDDLPNHGYYVSKGTSGNTITFTLFCINKTILRPNAHKLWEMNFSTPVANLINFLNFFSNHYYLANKKSILAYQTRTNNFIYVNSSGTVVWWPNGSKKLINSNKFCPLSRCGIVFRLKDDNEAELFTIPELRPFEPWRPFVNSLKAMSLESSILKNDYTYGTIEHLVSNSWKAGPIPITRKLCTIEISLEGKRDIGVHVSTPNTSLCRQINNKDLLNTLTENIMKELFEKNVKTVYESWYDSD